MSHCELRRVSVHADAVRVDLDLPAGVSIATLLPSIVDVVASRGFHPNEVIAAPYRLTRPGWGTLDASMTLAQHAIHDGAVLVVTRSDPEPPVTRCDDTAEAVATTVRAVTRTSTPRITRLSFALSATGFAAVAGFVAVPAGPGAPNVLLAATAAAAVAVLAIRLAGRAEVLLTTVSTVAALAAIAALAGVMTRAPLQVIGSVTAGVSVGLLQICGRVAVAAAGLSPRLGGDAAPAADQLDARAVRAHATLTGLVAALSTAATLGAVGTAIGVHTSGAPRHAGIVFAAVTGAVLLARARSHTDRCQLLALGAGGTVAVSASVVAVAIAEPQHPLANCAAAAALTVAALYGVCAPAPTFSPVVAWAVELLEYLALAAVTPLVCWICGVFGAARGLNLI